MLPLYTANFNLFKMAVQYQFFPILLVQMLFSQIEQALGPDLRMVGKSLHTEINKTHAIITLTFEVL